MDKIIGHPAVSQLLAQSAAELFLVFGLVAAGVGFGLIVNRTRMHALFVAANRWVSTRHATKWLAVPRDAWPLVWRLRYPLGASCMALAAFSIYALAVRIDVAQVARTVFAGLPYEAAIWFAAAARWVLIVGNLAAVVVGAMLLIAPERLHALDTEAGHWYSTRRYAIGGEAMHMEFDRWVERHARTSGWIMLAGGLFLIMNYGMLVLAHA